MEVEALRLKFQVGPSAEVGDALGGEVGVAKPWHAVRVLGWTFFMVLTVASLCNLLSRRVRDANLANTGRRYREYQKKCPPA